MAQLLMSATENICIPLGIASAIGTTLLAAIGTLFWMLIKKINQHEESQQDRIEKLERLYDEAKKKLERHD